MNNRWEEEYQGKAHWEIDRPSSHMSKLVPLLKPNYHILDAGCGSGKDSIHLATLGFTVSGIDISNEAIQRAIEKGKSIENTPTFEVGDVEKLPYPNQTFDAVYSGYVLHHSEIVRSFREISRVLKPGGIFYLVMFEEISYSETDEFNEHIPREKIIETINQYFEIVQDPKYDSYDETDQHGLHHHKRVVLVCTRK